MNSEFCKISVKFQLTWSEMQGLLRRKQSILKDVGVVETRDYPGYAETGIHPKVDVPRQRQLWAEMTARADAKQEELDAPRRVPQGVFLARQAMLPQYSGPVTKKARVGADQTGDGAMLGGFEHRGTSAQQQVIAGSGRPGAPPGYHYMSTGVLMRDG